MEVRLLSDLREPGDSWLVRVLGVLTVAGLTLVLRAVRQVTGA